MRYCRGSTWGQMAVLGATLNQPQGKLNPGQKRTKTIKKLAHNFRYS
jgi:hypothetical protein